MNTKGNVKSGPQPVQESGSGEVRAALSNEEIDQIVLEAFNHEDALDDFDTILEHCRLACQKVRDLLMPPRPDVTRTDSVRSGVEPPDVK